MPLWIYIICFSSPFLISNMELEGSSTILVEGMLAGQKVNRHKTGSRNIGHHVSRRANISGPSHDLCDHSESFKMVEIGVPIGDSVDKKLNWLRSQVIGNDVEFETPFGKRGLIYADHSASGRSLHYIEDFIINNLLPFYGNTHTCDSYVGQRTTKIVHEATEYIKKCLGGGQDDAILFCGSGTTVAIKRLQEVMGIAVPSILRERMLKSLSKEERWVVFVGPYEHHSNLLSWRQSLAEVVEIGLNEDGLLDVEALRLQLEAYKNANRPILGSFSACSNVTGICSDTQAIAQLLHQYGGFACFDFAASGPYVKIDLRSGEIDGYDAIFLSPHKFLGGPGSPGILLMSKVLYQLKSSTPSTCGGGTVNYVNDFSEKETLYLENIEERENGGTPQIIQTVRAALAFWVKEYIGYEEIEKREESYIKEAIERLLPNPNIKILGNITTKRQAILSFIIYSSTNSSSTNVENGGWGKTKEGINMWAETGNTRDKPLHGPFVATLLNDLFGIQARGGCTCAGPYGHKLLGIDRSQSLAIRSTIEKGYVGVKPGWARINFPYYMRKEDFEFILSAVEFLAIYGQRFLPLYRFNLRTGQWSLKKKEVKGLFKKGHSQIPIDQLERFKNETHSVEIEGIDHEIGGIKPLKKGGINKSYLDVAKSIASDLPKFPPQRKLKEDISLNLLHFRL